MLGFAHVSYFMGLAMVALTFMARMEIKVEPVIFFENLAVALILIIAGAAAGYLHRVNASENQEALGKTRPISLS